MAVRVFILALFLSIVAADQDRGVPKVVNISQGSVRGYKVTGDNYFTFLGIPYATAPVGPHKFKAPLPPPTWAETLEATDSDVICPQSHNIPNYQITRNFIQSENCLRANIYVPDTEKTNIPVIVYVHGGAFQLGYSDLFLQKLLVATGKVIIVNFNYRLGAHGFLCLGTEDAPGNAGLKDQVAALRWVKENIASFGGNPNDVTVAGYSAGSASAELLMLSPTTKGLFNKVILESGAAVGVWATQPDPLLYAKQFALKNGFTDVDDINALEHFYKTTSLDVLLADTFLDRQDSTFVFIPCVENANKEESFLTESPVNILKNGNYNKLPVLNGFANMEGLFRIPLFELWKDKMNANFSDFLPADLEFSSEVEKEKVAHKIKKFYFGDKAVTAETAENYVNYFTDVLFAYPILRSVKLNVDGDVDSIYLYHYSYVDESLPPMPYNLKGANHCAQSMALAEFSVFENTDKEVSEQRKNVKKMIVDLWLNFSLYGKPVPESTTLFPSGWPAVTKQNRAYMELNVNPELRSDLLKERFEFWDKIYDKYYKIPITANPKKQHSKEEL